MQTIVWGLIGLISFTFIWANEGEEIYKNKCASCHNGFVSVETLKKNFSKQNNTLLRLKAPTLNQLTFRLKEQIGDPRGDKEIHFMEISAFISEYVITPNRQKSICLPEILKFFDTMPSMEGQITEYELNKVSAYLYTYEHETTVKYAP